MLINTGSWYQELLKRPFIDRPVPYPPIENFTVTNDTLNFHMGFSVENLDEAKRIVFSVTNSKPFSQLLFSVENLIENRLILSVDNLNVSQGIVFSVENI